MADEKAYILPKMTEKAFRELTEGVDLLSKIRVYE